MFDAAAWVGRTVLGEHRLDSIAWGDESLAVFDATSVVDGGRYTVATAKNVVSHTSSMALEEAVARAGRHAVGVGALLPLLHARSEGEVDEARLWVVRRGGPLPTLASTIDGPRDAGEVARLLAPVAEALATLHDQGLAHGAVSTSTLVMQGDALALDLFGLSAAAEAAGGPRAARDVVPSAYRAPELLADSPTAPGPWTDTYALGLVAVALLTGRDDVRFRVTDGAVPTPRTLEIDVPDRVEDVLRLVLAVSPSPRPAVRTFLRDLQRHADPVVAPPAARASGGTPDAKPVAAPPYPAALAPAPKPAASRDRSTMWLVLGISLGLGVFGAAMIGAVAYVFHDGGATTASGGAPTSPPSPISPPVAPSSPPPPVPFPTPPTTPPRVRGVSTYPADQSALIPIETDAAVRGDRDALLTMVVFGDLTCPFTAKTLAQLPALEARYGGDLRIVFKHLPQAGNENARAASEASAAVLARSGPDAFFRFAELATKDERLDAGRLEELGIKVGLPAGAVTEAIARHSAGKLVDRDVELGRRLGMRGTPVLVYNGRRLDGYQPPEKLIPLLDGELGRTRAVLTKGTARDRMYAARVTANVTTSEGETRQ